MARHENFDYSDPEGWREYFREVARDAELRNITVDRVHKFGGTSMEQTGQVTDIIDSVRREGGSDIVVVSALAGVTDGLMKAWGDSSSLSPNDSINIVGSLIVEPHLEKATEIGLSEEELERFEREIGDLSVDLVEELRLSYSARRDVVLSFGERCSSRLLAASLRSQGVHAEAVDASEFIVTNPTIVDDPDIIWDRTEKQGRRVLGPLVKEGIIPIVTGFVGSTHRGTTTTLGRGGSDLTATAIGKIMRAKTVNIWTDVGGVYTGNPKSDPHATFISEMSYEQADSMARAGHKVLYPRTMEPLYGTNTTLVVRNTFWPYESGTRIVPHAAS